MEFQIGIDLGGTNIKAGLVNSNYEVIDFYSVKTELPRAADEIADKVSECAKKLAGKFNISLSDINSVGVGAPGIINPSERVVVLATNLDFKNVPFAKMVEERIGISVHIENDANAAIYGETLSGAAVGYKNIAMLTLGTGVGGGVIIDSKIFSGSNYLGAELGHTSMVYDGLQCLCGLRGCVEMYCSVNALIGQAREAMEKDRSSSLWNLAGGDVGSVEGKLIFDAAQQGDLLAKQVISRYQSYLGYAVANLVNTFQPEIVLIGGAVSAQGDELLEPVRKFVQKTALGYGIAGLPSSLIKPALLGNDAGIIGVAFLYNLHNKL